MARKATVVIQAGKFTAVGNRKDGLAATGGGRLDASAGGVVSRGNSDNGVHCSGEGCIVSLGSGSVVEKNKDSGILASDGGRVRLGSGGGRVQENKAAGLHAEGEGAGGTKARIEVGEGWEVCGNVEQDRRETGGGQIVAIAG